MTWTLFWDMHSGGGIKEDPFASIYIEAPEDEAKVIFYNRFGHNPERVSCTCCGDDYSISESPTFEDASAYHRKCAYDSEAQRYVERPDRRYNPSAEVVTVEMYKADPTVMVIHAGEIKDAERTGDVPEEGYIWH